MKTPSVTLPYAARFTNWGDRRLDHHTLYDYTKGWRIKNHSGQSGGAEHVKEFERLFAELRAEMQKHEPSCLLYSLLKSRTKSGTYIVHEQYRSQSALDAHEKSAHGAKYFPPMRAITEKFDVEYFDGVVD